MGVCCIVFDIDGMLFEFFMFSSRFMLFPTLTKKIGVKCVDIFFLEKKTNSFSFHVLCYSTVKKK